MKTLAPQKVDLVQELKNGTYKDLEIFNHELEKLLPAYEAAKEKISSIDESKLKELSRVGFKIHQKEKKVISEYEQIKNKIISKRNQLSSCGEEFFKILPKVVFDLGVKYDMKFLPLSEYTGEIDVNLVDKIKKFEEQNPYLLNRIESNSSGWRTYERKFNSLTYYILAPSEMFNSHEVTEVVTTRIMVDPVVIAISTEEQHTLEYLKDYVNSILSDSIHKEKIDKVEEKIFNIINSSNLFFIHKWGDDFTTKRIVRSFLKRALLPELSEFTVTSIMFGFLFIVLFTVIGLGCLLFGNSFIAVFTSLWFKIPVGICFSLALLGFLIDSFSSLVSNSKHKMNVITLNKNVTIEHKTEYVNRF